MTEHATTSSTGQTDRETGCLPVSPGGFGRHDVVHSRGAYSRELAYRLCSGDVEDLAGSDENRAREAPPSRDKAWRLILAISLLPLAGCTTLSLESGPFKASRTAWFIDIQADVELKTPDGTTVSAHSLQSTVNTKALETLISAAAMVKP